MDVFGSSNWVYVIFIGFIVGIMARLLKPGRDKMGFFMTIILGICGAVFATWLGQLLNFYGPKDNAGFLGGLIGAILILIIADLIRKITKKRS